MTKMYLKHKGNKDPELVFLLGACSSDGKLYGIVMHDPRKDIWRSAPYEKVKLNRLALSENDVANYFGDLPLEEEVSTVEAKEVK